MIKTFTILPAPPLRSLVHHYWVMRTDGETVNESIFPPTCMKWIFHRGTPFAIDGAFDVDRKATVCLQYEHAVSVNSCSGALDMICVFFRPYATKAIMGVSAGELTGRLIDLEEMGDLEITRLKYRVNSAENNDEAIQLIETFLLDKIKSTEVTLYLNQLERTFEMLNSNPLIRISELAGSACLCERQFRTVFEEHVGVSP
ncbi:MAG: hypothetical protein Q4B58_01540, partial [Bacteroidales bacterium]|nr:hypothetical protein [Bacteroidales bacterium]